MSVRKECDAKRETDLRSTKRGKVPEAVVFFGDTFQELGSPERVVLCGELETDAWFGRREGREGFERVDTKKLIQANETDAQR